MINTLRELPRADDSPEIDVENSAGGGGGYGACGGVGGDDDRGGAADGHAAALDDGAGRRNGGGAGDGGGGSDLSRRCRSMSRSRATAVYIGADPLAPVHGWNWC